MSEGSISQAEIDALLAGVDMGSIGGSSSSSTKTFTDAQKEALGTFFSNIRVAVKSNYDSMTGADITVEGPDASVMSRDGLLKALPEMVVATVADFSGGLAGDHVFIQSEELAKKLVGLVNNEPGVELDDMAFSVISETISQHIGVELTELGHAGIRDVANNPPETVHVPKAMVRFPQQDFAVFQYTLKIDGTDFPLWEAVQYQTALDIAKAFGAPDSSNGNSNGKVQTNDSFSATMNGAANVAQPVYANSGVAQSGAFAMNTNPGVIQGQQMANPSIMQQGMAPPNVQPVQFPNLQNTITPQEQGNISLIMDVYMEMTVELGRTKKVIKDILGMGEGTIIELDKLAGEPVDILVNHKPIAKGEVVVIDENFGVRVTEILSPSERISDA